MKPIYKYLACGIIGGLIVLFFMRSCEGNPGEPRTVKTERIVKQFDTVTVFKQLPSKRVYTYITKTDTIQTENPLNQRYFDKWKAAEGRFEQRDSLYFDAITEREYNTPFEDSLVKIDVYSKVQGNMLAQSPKYTLKPRLVKVPPPPFRVLVGIDVSNNFKSDAFAVGANVGFQNRKGYALRFGYDTDETYKVGVDLPILNIK